jgi:hypothetical protein
MSLTSSKGIKKQTENEATGPKREKDFSSRHDKQKEEVPSISVSDVEKQLKNFEITTCETKNIEGKLKKLAISVPEGVLCERSPMGNEKRHINNYNPYAVSCPICFSAF